jgi:hypothetical protein
MEGVTWRRPCTAFFANRQRAPGSPGHEPCTWSVEATTTDYDTPAAAAASDPNDPERKSPAEAGLSFGRGNGPEKSRPTWQLRDDVLVPPDVPTPRLCGDGP